MEFIKCWKTDVVTSGRWLENCFLSLTCYQSSHLTDSKKVFFILTVLIFLLSYETNASGSDKNSNHTQIYSSPYRFLTWQKASFQNTCKRLSWERGTLACPHCWMSQECCLIAREQKKNSSNYRNTKNISVSYDLSTYFKECIQLGFTSFNLVTVCIAEWEVGEHFLWAFDVWKPQHWLVCEDSQSSKS